MRYKPKASPRSNLRSVACQIECGLKWTLTSVRELRMVTVWPENLAITTPQDRHPENAVRVSKVSVATRLAETVRRVCY